MPYWVAQLCDGITACWIAATPADYGKVAVVIVLVGWLVTHRPTTT